MKCCERDTDNDGNCDIHAAPGLLRCLLPPAASSPLERVKRQLAEAQHDLEIWKASAEKHAQETAVEHNRADNAERSLAEVTRELERANQKNKTRTEIPSAEVSEPIPIDELDRAAWDTFAKKVWPPDGVPPLFLPVMFYDEGLNETVVLIRDCSYCEAETLEHEVTVLRDNYRGNKVVGFKVNGRFRDLQLKAAEATIARCQALSVEWRKSLRPDRSRYADDLDAALASVPAVAPTRQEPRTPTTKDDDHAR